MTPERLRQIEELFHAVRERSVDERPALLARADPDLRREVESLLAQRSDHLVLERPAFEANTQSTQDWGSSTPQAGTCLGPYRLVNKLGEGGMGEVFRAVDTRLGRTVAIKITHARFNDRFDREARAISSLNHPNICTLYDVGPNYLVMELVDGETLASRLAQGALPADVALRYGAQILAALAEAHQKGIVHRDLKPGNVMLTKTGVKVLDFGLATLEGATTLTVERMVMGTPAYMAPEQREGKPTDARTDLYAFGLVLREMLTGSRAGDVPTRRLEQIVSRCLEDDPSRRWQSAADLQQQLAVATPTRRRATYVAVAVAAAAMLAVAAWSTYVALRRVPQLTEKDTVVLADFTNQTGDPVFDGALRQGLSFELEQSPFTVISDSKVQQLLPLMGQPKDARVTPEIAQQICERTASAMVLDGSIARIGSQYVLGLRARNCTTGTILDQQQIQVSRQEDVLDALSQITRKFRTRAGESLATVEKQSTLPEATTSSIEALKAYSAGGAATLSSSQTAGIPSYRRAVELDPEFAMAHARLGLAYSGAGESKLSAEHTAKAWRLRNRVSDREKFYIDFTYDRQVTGNLEKAYRTLELWYQTYPRAEQPNPRGLFGGISTHGTGRYERAITASLAGLADDPDSGMSYGNLAGSYFLTGRFAEAEKTIQTAFDRKVQFDRLLAIQYNIAALKGDQAQLHRAVALARGRAAAEHWLTHAEALALARSGRLQAAARLSNRAVDLAMQAGDEERAASYQAARATWESLAGNGGDATRNATAALERSDGRDVQYAAALALGFSGTSPRSEALAGDLEHRFPEDTFVKFTYVPVLRGLAELARGKAEASVERLQVALPYELAANGLNFMNYYLGGLHSAYVRGGALIALRRYGEAAAEFQKILDNPGLVGTDPIGVLVHLQLGRVFVLSGDRTKAKAAYETFLSSWKDADPDVPILKRARAEYARL
jgi:hypothetical protein